MDITLETARAQRQIAIDSGDPSDYHRAALMFEELGMQSSADAMHKREDHYRSLEQQPILEMQA